MRAVLLLWFAASEDLLKQGADAMRAGHFAEAERIYRQLTRQSPDNPQLRLNLGLALTSGKKHAEAIPELQRFLKANPKPGPVHLVLGAAMLKTGRPCDAIVPLEAAMEWGSSPEVLMEAGDAYSGCKRYLDAANAYSKLARLRPGEAKYARAAARAYWQAREYEQAKPLYAALEAKAGDDPRFLYEYGETLSRADGAAAGLPYLQRAVEADSKMTPARGALGRALMELDRPADALPHLEAASNTDATLLLPLSRALKALGRADEGARAEAEYRSRVGRQN
jgi:predicted Zn-dependent protease